MQEITSLKEIPTKILKMEEMSKNEQQNAFENLKKIVEDKEPNKIELSNFKSLSIVENRKINLQTKSVKNAVNVTDKKIQKNNYEIANFSVEITAFRDEIFRNESNSYVEMNICWKNFVYEFKVKKEEFVDLHMLISKNFPQCQVKNITKFRETMAELYGSFSGKKYKFYHFGGWLKEENQLVFLNSSMNNVDCDMKLNVNYEEAKNFLFHYLKTSWEKEKLWILLLYSLNAACSIFYEECRIEGIRSVLYISAPTGTGKTSLTKILSSALLIEGTKPLLRFDDTIASIEESLANSLDKLVLIDDFYAKGTKIEEQAFKSKASAITRIMGDGMIRGKMGANRKPLADRKYRGGIIATGEYIDLNTHSSYLRCWVLNLKAGSIFFGEDLSILQQYPNLARSFFSLWIFWLQKNQEKIKKELLSRHEYFLEEVRKNYSVPYARLISSITGFLTVASLVNDFFNEFQFDIDCKNIYLAIKKEAKSQIKLVEDISPEQIVIKALNDAIDNAFLKISDTEDNFRKFYYDGFYDEDSIVIITSQFENILENFVNKNGYGLKFNDALKLELVLRQILLPGGKDGNLKYTKTREIEPKRPRIYKFNRGVLKNE